MAYDGDLIAYGNGDSNVTVHNWRIGADRLARPYIADADHVLSTADGCLLVADLAARLAAAPAAGSCARTEVALIGYNAPIRRDCTVQLRVRCVAAPRVSRGTLHVTLAKSAGRSTNVRFSIPAGGRATLAPRLTAAAYAATRRDETDLGVSLLVHGVIVDPGGRHNRFRGGVSGRVR